jgi:endonuclease YncB( thermonuclease family)
MREFKLLNTTHRLVACALAMGVLQISLVLAASRPEPTARAITGPASAIDGDTIDVGGTRIRLEGIDAPESGQTCNRRYRLGWWACGTAATNALIRMLEGRTVRCEPRGTDRYGRMLAVCFADGRDINAAMVREGHAWAFVRYSQAYVAEEKAARAEGRGIWQAESETPWDYRAKRWAGAEQKAPEGCAIKGNVTKNGRIYHMPWSPWYGQIHIDPEKGKRWFCSEAEAIAAGWRPVETH